MANVTYPADHKVGLRVPKGGSDCAKCEYVDGQKCKNTHFQQWNKSDVIPLPTNEYCCDFYEMREGKNAFAERSRVARAQ